ncbi:protein unc-13 homolog C-like [Frankliniella occidentalis]|uniref:Protein unc-13 homolog C-like n=1 Tax=Frankliniella occidentalis TaxID=133901 RepID=A0A6J1T6A0_FRAOC|nr:protein unc-13 homolog C-like [Frankliniella occidentalis]
MSQKELITLISECLKPVKTEITRLTKEVEDLQVEVLNLSKDISQKDKKIEELEGRLEEHEQYSRRNNLRIFGVTESPKENTDDLVVKVAKKINVDIDVSQIDRSHRIGKPGSNPRPIIVKFIGYGPRQAMFRAKKALKGSGITIREDLTKQRLDLLKGAAEVYFEKNVWSHDGVIMVKIGDHRPFRLKRSSELDSLMEKHEPPS